MAIAANTSAKTDNHFPNSYQ